MRTRRTIVLLCLAVVAVAVLAACGSKSKRNVPSNAVAVVGSEVVLRSQFDAMLAQSKAQYTQAHKAFPALGSTGYESIRTGIVNYLVESAAIDQEAANMGVNVTSAEVNTALQQAITQQFKGNKAKYQAELRKEHLTEQQLLNGFRQQLISQRVQTQLTQSVKVSKSDIKKYYDANKKNYKVGESRAASHILVKPKALADKIYVQLKAGANFAKLAKKYSLDSSKSSGGSLGVSQKAQLVPAFAKVLFELKTGTFSKPTKTIYGWHVILATGPIVPAHTQSLKEASASIESTLLSDKQKQAVTDWVAESRKYAKTHTTYAAGFAPPKSSTSTVPTTTT